MDNHSNRLKEESRTDIWDFDLLTKSDADVFDVNFLQSQGNNSTNRDRKRDNDIVNDQSSHGKNNNVSMALPRMDDQSIRDEKLAKLTSAGFDTVMAHQALESSQWDMELAVDVLINGSGSPSRQIKSPTRQSEVLQAFGMSMFKSAQKVFDYSKKKITQVVESSKSSGWKSERRDMIEKSESFYQSSYSKDNGSSYSPEKQDMSHLEYRIDHNLGKNSVKVEQSPHAAVALPTLASVSQKKEESLLIGDLTESAPTKQVTAASTYGNQNLDLFNDSIEFTVDGSQNILNPAPSQFSAQPLKNDISKSHNSKNIPVIPSQPFGALNLVDFSNVNQSYNSSSVGSQVSQNIKALPNQSLKSSNGPDSNSFLVDSGKTQQKPSHLSNLDSLDPFRGASELNRSKNIATNISSISSKKQMDDFTTLPADVGTGKAALLYPSQNDPFSQSENQTANKKSDMGLFDDSFDFLSTSGKAERGVANSSNTKNTSEKKPFTQSFMIFDSLSDDKGKNSISFNAITQNSSQKLEADIYKEKGNDFFKSGQYAEAETQYTLGIKSISGHHPILAALYNNRAGARLKIGSYTEVIQDCDKVQELEPNEVKSLLRRAQAYEALEKWDEALSDYRKILLIDPTVKSVSQSLARCSKARQSSASSEAPFTRPAKATELTKKNVLQPTHFSFKSKNIEATAAVQYVREKNRLAEDEDALKFQLKDQIDDRIQLWRKGKEDNLRALLSSLDAVLWKGLEWRTINLSEILTKSQVKAKYLQAIGKVHPDKLGSNISVENQLIANSVFSTLNKAWDTFKAQNGM